jgi:hypothetical protein
MLEANKQAIMYPSGWTLSMRKNTSKDPSSKKMNSGYM